MERKFMKGCEAIAEAALRAGCRFFAGYPITPQNEIPEYMARMLPKLGGAFVQGESEIASISMVIGAAVGGTLAMTSSSGPGISLKSEGISNLAGAKIPAVIINVMRGGPGVGTIQPAQADYNQMTKATGHGGFRTITFAPESIQEAVDLTYKSFEYAMRDRNPVLIAADGFIGAMMEPVTLPPYKEIGEKPDWALTGNKGTVKVSVSGRANEVEQMEFNIVQAKMYDEWQEKDVMVDEYLVEDAEIIIAAYGTSARICRTAIKNLREKGVKVGMIRPITISPFPYKSFEKLDKNQVKFVMNVEMSIPAQMIFDVKQTMDRDIPVYTCLTSAGVILDSNDIVNAIVDKTEAR